MYADTIHARAQMQLYPRCRPKLQLRSKYTHNKHLPREQCVHATDQDGPARAFKVIYLHGANLGLGFGTGLDDHSSCRANNTQTCNTLPVEPKARHKINLPLGC